MDFNSNRQSYKEKALQEQRAKLENKAKEYVFLWNNYFPRWCRYETLFVTSIAVDSGGDTELRVSIG